MNEIKNLFKNTKEILKYKIMIFSFLFSIFITLSFIYLMETSENVTVKILFDSNTSSSTTITSINGMPVKKNDNWIYSRLPRNNVSNFTIGFNNNDNENQQIYIYKIYLETFFKRESIEDVYNQFSGFNDVKLSKYEDSLEIFINKSAEQPYMVSTVHPPRTVSNTYTMLAIAKTILLFIVIYFILIISIKYLENVKKESNIKKYIIQLIYVILIVFLFCFLMIVIMQNSLYNAINWISIYKLSFFKSYIFVLLFTLAFMQLLGSVFFPITFIGIITILLAIINNFKIQYQGKPLLPWDILSVNTLFNVSSTLNINLTIYMKISLIIFILVSILSLFIPIIKSNNRKKEIIFKLTGFLGVIIIFIFYTKFTYFSSKSIITFDGQLAYYQQNGLINSFLSQCKFTNIKEPKGYDKNKLEVISNGILKKESKNIKNRNINNPNIIMIMSEAFWDITEINNIKFNEELLPTINKLRNESIHGYIFSPVFGGMTANTEFEALTGFTTQFLNEGTVPYQQYINKDFFSIAHFLKEKGYFTQAIHPFNSTSYDRNLIYPLLGFDEFLSFNDFINPELERGYVSDLSVSKKIISEYEKNRDNRKFPWFNFTVTVQNHGSYTSENYLPNELVNFEASNLSIDVIDGIKDLATGLNSSDKALKYLINYFSNIKEPTIIIFFGDHMSALGKSTYSLYEESGYLNGTNEEEKVLKTHLTPFIVWNNFNSKNDNIGIISSYQIMPLVMESFNLEMPPYFEFLNHIRQESTGFSNNILLDAKSKIQYNPTHIQEELYYKLQLIQYDYMFGKQYSLNKLFQVNK